MTALADPTAALLDRFKNAASWDHIDRGIPVMKPHKAIQRNPVTGKKDVETVYDTARLQKMCNVLNERLRTSGVVPVMMLGHTRQPVGEYSQEEQPEIVGYWFNWRVGTFGPSNKPALLMDRYFLPGTYEKAKKYPFRSAEFYPEEICRLVPNEVGAEMYDAITAVALLKIEPKLDMGITTYAKSALVCYWLGDDDMDPQMCNEPPVQSGDDKVYQEFKPHFQRCMNEDFPHMAKYYKEHIASKYGMAEPSAENAVMPEPVKKEPEPKAEPSHMSQAISPVTPAPAATVAPTVENELLRQHQAQFDIMRAQYQRDLSAVQAKLEVLEAENALNKQRALVAIYERDLGHLLAQGYEFDLPWAVKKSSKMDTTAFKEFTEEIKANYRRAPIGAKLGEVNGQRIIPNSALGQPDEEPPTLDDANLAVQYMEKNRGKVTYEESWDHVQEEKKKKRQPVAA